MEQFFDGSTVGDGLVFDRSGKLIREFQVSIQGEWDGKDTLTLNESFVYKDGEKSKKKWVVKVSDGQNGVRAYSGKMEDIVGFASGQALGKALHMQYDMRVQSKGSEWVIDFDDWMWKVDDTLVMNKIVMRKFGLKVGEILITFRKAR